MSNLKLGIEWQQCKQTLADLVYSEKSYVTQYFKVRSVYTTMINFAIIVYKYIPVTISSINVSFFASSRLLASQMYVPLST